jgi:uncharacterized protein YndB with AHSA1/START domain
MWTTEYAGETTASPAQVFALLADPATWPEWNAGVARVHLDGPFTGGAQAVMTFPDGGELPFTILRVEDGLGFEDETSVPDAGVVVRVRHEVVATGTGSRIVYAVAADGPEEAAAAVGAGVSEDFPAVIAALAALAEARA